MLKVGDRFRVPKVTPGHDNHKETDVFTVSRVIVCPKYDHVSYKGKDVYGRNEWWPHTRVVKV